MLALDPSEGTAWGGQATAEGGFDMGGNLFGMTTYVCSKCGRRADEFHIRGWLIGTHADPERAYNGEMVIRCPEHITQYAVRHTVGGKSAIRS